MARQADSGGAAPAVIYGPQPVSVWAADILANVGAPHTQNNVNNIAAWYACESGTYPGFISWQYNNLFNTEQFASARNGYVQGTIVPTFGSYNTGLWATLMTMRMPFASPIIAALRADADRASFSDAVARSGWGTSGGCIASSAASAGMVAGTGLRPAGPAGGFRGKGGLTAGAASGAGSGCVPGLIFLPWILARALVGGWHRA